MRHFSLTIGEEEVLAERHPKVLWLELKEKLRTFHSVPPEEFCEHPDLRRANSLLWVWVHMRRNLVQGNLRIMLARRGVKGALELSRLIGRNEAYTRLMLSMNTPAGMAAWSLPNLFRLAQALKVSPTKLLSLDLRRVIDRSLAR